RQAEGKVVVLMAEDTRDEAFFWISRRREKEMASQLAELKAATDDIEDSVGDDGQAGLGAFADESGGDAEATEDTGGEGETADDGGDAGLTDFAADARGEGDDEEG
ncbi:Hef nuclease, partial [Halorubrum sp. SP3]